MQTQEMTTLTDKVLDLLEWSEDQHSQFIYECGLEYLRHYIKDESPEIIDHILRSRIFWNWWKLHWRKRDLAYINGFIMRLKASNCQLIYEELHNPRTLAAQIYPNGIVLGESYASMIAELNDQVTHAA